MPPWRGSERIGDADEPFISRVALYATSLSAADAARLGDPLGQKPDPGTSYHFRIWAEGQECGAGRFTTAPAGAPDFSFGVWADSQGTNHGAYEDDPFEPTKSLLRHLAASDVDFAVAVGDLAENGNSNTDTHPYYLDRVACLLGPTVPWFVSWGNHDRGRDAVIRQFADLPSQDRPGFDAGYGSYSFDYAGCHFICLDYATDAGDISTWLESDLQSEANRHAKFTFLFVHVPPYCELWIDGDAYYRSGLVPLLEAYGVDVCFSGHTHEYSRGFLHGVHYCITGGGSWLDSPEVLVWDWAHMTVGGCHAIPGVPQLGPGRGGGLINEYVRVDVQGDSCAASTVGFAPDGTTLGVLDRFSLTWTVVSRERLPRVFGHNRLTVPSVVHGQSVYAESHRRAGVQRQYLTTPDFDCGNLTQVTLVFLSNYIQNEDSLAALEFSIDHGASWFPVTYLLDTADVVFEPDGLGIDATATFTRVDPSQVPTASGAASGGTYGEHISSRPFENLDPFLVVPKRHRLPPDSPRPLNANFGPGTTSSFAIMVGSDILSMNPRSQTGHHLG